MITVKGGMRKSDTCSRCYVDNETGKLIPCKKHVIRIPKPKKKKDISLKLPLEFRF